MTATQDTYALVSAYYAAFNRQDVAGMLALLAEDVLHEPSQGTPRAGKALFADFLARMNHRYRETVIVRRPGVARRQPRHRRIHAGRAIPPDRRRPARRVGKGYRLRVRRILRDRGRTYRARVAPPQPQRLDRTGGSRLTMDTLARIIAQHAASEARCCPSCMTCRPRSAASMRRPKRRSPARSTSAAPKCMAWSVSITISAPTPIRARRVQLCRAEACQARGVEALVPAAEAAAGQRVRLSKVYYLGLCSVGPAARVGDTVHARLDVPALTALIEAA